jgi:hypothetical protein
MAPKMFDKIDMDTKVKASGNGYWYVCTIPEHPFGEKRDDRKKKYIYLHRAILEKKLGRYLTHNEQADHIDGDKDNNSSDNVRLKTLGEHQKEHAENGNHFWTKSPRNKKRRKGASTSMVRNVLKKFFS